MRSINLAAAAVCAALCGCVDQTDHSAEWASAREARYSLSASVIDADCAAQQHQPGYSGFHTQCMTADQRAAFAASHPDPMANDTTMAHYEQNQAAAQFCAYQGTMANNYAPGGVMAQTFAALNVQNSCMEYYRSTGKLPGQF
jgi:hypothetical protein